jgi:hypothetical protein
MNTYIGRKHNHAIPAVKDHICLCLEHAGLYCCNQFYSCRSSEFFKGWIDAKLCKLMQGGYYFEKVALGGNFVQVMQARMAIRCDLERLLLK